MGIIQPIHKASLMRVQNKKLTAAGSNSFRPISRNIFFRRFKEPIVGGPLLFVGATNPVLSNELTELEDSFNLAVEGGEQKTVFYPCLLACYALIPTKSFHFNFYFHTLNIQVHTCQYFSCSYPNRHFRVASNEVVSC